MPYSFDGVCYDTTEAVGSAFVASFPTIGPSGLSSLVGTPTTDANGLVQWTISSTSFVTGETSVRTGSTQLPSCSLPASDQYPVQSILVVCALFFAMLNGFRTGFRP